MQFYAGLVEKGRVVCGDCEGSRAATLGLQNPRTRKYSLGVCTGQLPRCGAVFAVLAKAAERRTKEFNVQNIAGAAWLERTIRFYFDVSALTAGKKMILSFLGVRSATKHGCVDSQRAPSEETVYIAVSAFAADKLSQRSLLTAFFRNHLEPMRT